MPSLSGKHSENLCVFCEPMVFVCSQIAYYLDFVRRQVGKVLPFAEVMRFFTQRFYTASFRKANLFLTTYTNFPHTLLQPLRTNNHLIIYGEL